MGTRGPAPLPSNVHLLNGNPSKLPPGRLKDSIRPDVRVPKPPVHLDVEAKREWKRVGAELAVLGIISEIDRAALAGYCQAWAEVVKCEKRITDLNAADPEGQAGLIGITPSGYQQMSVWVQIRNRAYERMMTFAAQFGMSPSSRARIQVSTQQDLFGHVNTGTDTGKPSPTARFFTGG